MSALHATGGAGRGRGLRIGVQALGFLVSVGLLVWAGGLVFGAKNVEQRERLWSAPWYLVVLLPALSVATHLLNGALFQQTLYPVRRLRFWEVQGVNAMATLLASLPFKMSVMLRVLIHNRRDGVPVFTIGAWFIAMAVVMLASAVPVLGVSLWRGRVDGVWLVCVLAGMVGMAGIVVASARVLSRGAGWRWVESVWFALPLPRRVKGERGEGEARAGLLGKVHEGLRMLGHARAVGICVGLRALDAGVQTGRFLVAARVLGIPLATDHAVLAGSSYYLIGALAPTGSLGAREGGTGLIGKVLWGSGAEGGGGGGLDVERFFLIIGLVTAADLMVLLVGGVIGMVCLRPWRLMRGG